jgi:hypothetical protein
MKLGYTRARLDDLEKENNVLLTQWFLSPLTSHTTLIGTAALTLSVACPTFFQPFHHRTKLKQLWFAHDKLAPLLYIWWALKRTQKDRGGGGNRSKGKSFLGTGNVGIFWFINIFKVICRNKYKR